MALDAEITALGLALFFVSFFVLLVFRMFTMTAFQIEYQYFVLALMIIGLAVTFIGMLVTRTKKY